MSAGDEQIGRNLAKLRGDMSQAELARRMKERGWKWAQNTVSAVESGDRPLRLAEARDLVDALGVGPYALETLTSADAYVELRAALNEMTAASFALGKAGERYESAQEVLAIAADQARDAGVETGHTQAAVRDWLSQRVDRAVRDLVIDDELLTPEDHAHNLAMNERAARSKFWMNLYLDTLYEMHSEEAAWREELYRGVDSETP